MFSHKTRTARAPLSYTQHFTTSNRVWHKKNIQHKTQKIAQCNTPPMTIILSPKLLSNYKNRSKNTNYSTSCKITVEWRAVEEKIPRFYGNMKVKLSHGEILHWLPDLAVKERVFGSTRVRHWTPGVIIRRSWIVSRGCKIFGVNGQLSISARHKETTWPHARRGANHSKCIDRQVLKKQNPRRLWIQGFPFGATGQAAEQIDLNPRPSTPPCPSSGNRRHGPPPWWWRLGILPAKEFQIQRVARPCPADLPKPAFRQHRLHGRGQNSQQVKGRIQEIGVSNRGICFFLFISHWN